MSSTAEETMISYGPPMAKPEVEAELPFANYVNNYRPPLVCMAICLLKVER